MDNLQDFLQVQSFLFARFCHDISGVIGAVDNSLDFLSDKNKSIKERAYNIIKTSAYESVARLKFYRQAYGNTTTIGSTNLGQLVELSAAFFSGGKIIFKLKDNNIDQNLELDPIFGKIIYNMIIFAATTLIYGGEIELDLTHNSKVTVSAHGKLIKQDDESISMLRGEDKNIPLNSKNVQPKYCYLLAKSIGTEVTFSADEQNLTLETKIIK